MDKKFSVFDFLAQIFVIYGITVVLLNIFCVLFGESAQAYSSIFALGSRGLTVQTMLQFLAAIAVITVLRFVFMTDRLIRKMPLTARIAAMFTGTFLIILAFIFLCGWFPAEEPMAWILFLICFAVSCTVSTLISACKENMENRKLADALQKFKEEQL